MKKFILKIICFLVIIFWCIEGLNIQYIRASAPRYLDKYNDVPKDISIANVGSSHGLWGFCYEDLQETYTCFNFAMESQTLSYDYRVLEQYEDSLEEDGVMLVVLSYFSFFFEEEKESNFEAKNARYYKILEPKYIKNYSVINDVCYRYFPVLGANKGLLEILTQKPQTKNQDLENWKRTAEELDVAKNAEAAIERHITNNRDEEGRLNINQEEIEGLYNLIELCKKKNIRVVMVTTPYLQEYNDLVPEDCREEFHNIIKEVQKDTGVEYYDYSADRRFTNDYKLFMNSDHLNKAGAIKFTSILWEEINK